MDVAALLAGAQEQAGSDDYGPDADAMHEALEVLVRSANEEAALSEQGEMVFAGMIGSLLTRRLQVEQWYAAHPEIGDQQIESVLFGLGLPRTGSTALSYLLAQDPAVRNLRQWEASQPTPPPELATEDDRPALPRRPGDDEAASATCRRSSSRCCRRRPTARPSASSS